jgi:hypothetical protein
VQVSIHVHLPSHPSSGFSIIQSRTDVPLEAAEVGEVTIPIATAAGVPPGEYPISAEIAASYEARGLYIRSQKSPGQLGKTLLTFDTGMALSRTLGLGFETRTQPKPVLDLCVAGAPQPGPSPDLTPTYLSHWTVADLTVQGKARRYVNDQRLYLLPKMTRQALYLTFLEESQERLREAHLPLHMGEALTLARILTFAVEYFSQVPDRQDAVLVPAYVLAYRYDLPTDDPVFLVARADYARIARLAISLSFGLLRRRVGRDVWSIEEQRAVADFVAQRVEHGGPLPAEFLYLPLLLGGLLVADQVQMPGEEIGQSLELLAQAREKRVEDLAENPELVGLLDTLLAGAQRDP